MQSQQASGADKHDSAHPMPLEKSAEFGEMYKFKLLGGIEKAQLRHQPSWLINYLVDIELDIVFVERRDGWSS